MAQNDHRGIIPPSHPNSKSVFCLSGSTAILHIKLNSRISLRGEKFISLAKRNTQQFVTSTVMRRSVTGDAGSLLRLHQFLMDFRMLNGGQIGETAPGDAVLRGLHTAGGALAGSKLNHSSAMAWTSDRIHSLEASVVKHVSKKTGGGSPDQVNLVVKWDAVAR
jgi:SWI/SNF related-matrix-associated actin-dependent regulator of chromatin subfamily C